VYAPPLAQLIINGTVVASSTTATTPLSALTDNNVWLGRSQWGDPLFNGSINELRIHDRPLTLAQLTSSMKAGPDAMDYSVPNIVWVSFHSADDMPSTDAVTAGFTEAPDIGYTDLLRDSGYNVTRVMTANDLDVDGNLDIAAADLVIIGRSVDSGNYQQATETAEWNGLNKPVIITGGYLLRANRLGFMTGNTIPDTTNTVSLAVNDVDHPIFSRIPLNATSMMLNPYANIASYTNNPQRGISVVTDPANAGGNVLATLGTNYLPAVGMVIGEWQAGATMSNGSMDTLGGHRLVFLTGSREQSGLDSEGSGIYDLEPDGARMFLNAVAYMLPSAGGPGGGDIELAIAATAPDSVTLTWTGGNGPFLVQGRQTLGTGNWVDLMTTTERTAVIPMATSTLFLRVQDEATGTVRLFRASLNGANERPAPGITTPARGVGLLAVNGTQATYWVRYWDLTTPISNAHVHGPASVDASAGVLFLTPLAGGGAFPGPTSGQISGTQTLTAEQLTAIETGMTYFNIHSQMHAGGEIRGQILP
jgi:hypothetical protein